MSTGCLFLPREIIRSRWKAGGPSAIKAAWLRRSAAAYSELRTRTAPWRTWRGISAASSRNGNELESWPQLTEEIAHAVRAQRVVLDGEICRLAPDRRSNCNALLFRREWPYFYAFDILSLEGRDLTALPLLQRQRILLRVLPEIECRLLYLDHLPERGRDLYRVACERDLGSIVEKWAHGAYRTDGAETSWVKIKNPSYTQIRDRHELFD